MVDIVNSSNTSKITNTYVLFVEFYIFVSFSRRIIAIVFFGQIGVKMV